MTAPWSSKPAIDAARFVHVRLQAIFDCCKWDPQVEDVPTQKVRAATYPCGVELIAGAAVEKFLGSRGPGIHHVTLAVDDIEARLAALKAAGVRLIHPEPVPGAGGCRVAFVHPSATGGVLLELKEKP